MRPVPLKSDHLQTLLSNITRLCHSDEFKKVADRVAPRLDSLIDNEKYPAYSDEYLREALKLKSSEFGYPRGVLGFGTGHENYTNYKMFSPLEKQVKKISGFLGTPKNALTMVYPENGFIGWHHNGNAPGYNILLTYSQDGDGCFKYYDKAADEIVTIQDKPGWQVKVGYYPNQAKEKERIYWHAAQTKKQRISVAWIIDHRPMWINMISEISKGDYDKDFVLSQGPLKDLVHA